MCPIAAESKNPKSRSKKKLSKDVELTPINNLEENTNFIDQKSDNEIPQGKVNLENNEYSLTDEEAKNLSNVKLGPKGTYTEDSIRVYLQEIGRIRLLRPDEEIELARKIADLLQLEELATQFESEKGYFPSVREWAELIEMPLSKFRRRLLLGRRAKEKMVQSNLRLVVSIAKNI